MLTAPTDFGRAIALSANGGLALPHTRLAAAGHSCTGSLTVRGRGIDATRRFTLAPHTRRVVRIALVKPPLPARVTITLTLDTTGFQKQTLIWHSRLVSG